MSLLLACGSPPAGPSASAESSAGGAAEQAEPAIALGEVHAKIDFTRPGEPTGDLIGWSLDPATRYAPEGDPLHPEWRTPARVAAAQALAETRPGHGRAPLMRFAAQIDGARGRDGYHFYRWVDPTHAPAAGDGLASFEAFALMQDADAAPIIGLNFGSGTASEAAAYVRHLNGDDPMDRDVAARLHWGMGQPYRQALFELGDASWAADDTGFAATGEFAYASPTALAGDPAWHGRPSASAADFAARGLEFVAAVRAASPPARLWVPLAPGSMDAWGGVESAAMSLAPLLKDQAITGAAIRHDLAGDAAALGWRDPNDPGLRLGGGVELVRPEFRRARAALDAVRPELPLVVTEFAVAGGDQASAGLAVAEMLIFYAQVGVAAACQRVALEEVEAAPWLAPVRLVAEHLLERSAPIEVVKQVRKDMSVGTRTIEVPLVHAAAFVDPDGGAGSLVLLHRDPAAARVLTIDVPEGWTATAGAQWAPPAPDHDARRQPIAPEALAWAQEGARVQVTLRPHSLAALRFAAP